MSLLLGGVAAFGWGAPKDWMSWLITGLGPWATPEGARIALIAVPIIAAVLMWLPAIWSGVRGLSGGAPAPVHMTLQEVARYVAHRSRFGLRSRFAMRGMMDAVEMSAVADIEQMLRAGNLRAIGFPPNSSTPEDIPNTYWQFAGLDHSTLISGSYERSSVRRLNWSVQIVHYMRVLVATSDVVRAWPGAGVLYRAYQAAKLTLWHWWNRRPAWLRP